MSDHIHRLVLRALFGDVHDASVKMYADMKLIAVPRTSMPHDDKARTHRPRQPFERNQVGAFDAVENVTETVENFLARQVPPDFCGVMQTVVILKIVPAIQKSVDTHRNPRIIGKRSES